MNVQVGRGVVNEEKACPAFLAGLEVLGCFLLGRPRGFLQFERVRVDFLKRLVLDAILAEVVADLRCYRRSAATTELLAQLFNPHALLVLSYNYLEWNRF